MGYYMPIQSHDCTGSCVLIGLSAQKPAVSARTKKLHENHQTVYYLHLQKPFPSRRSCHLIQQGKQSYVFVTNDIHHWSHIQGSLGIHNIDFHVLHII